MVATKKAGYTECKQQERLQVRKQANKTQGINQVSKQEKDETQLDKGLQMKIQKASKKIKKNICDPETKKTCNQTVRML